MEEGKRGGHPKGSSSNGGKCYSIIAAQNCEQLAKEICDSYPDRFSFFRTEWGKFPDGTDNIQIGGFHPRNMISGQNVLFLASFHNNDATLSQFQVMIVLLQSFIESLTIVLPFSPVGTMDRVLSEGRVATANTYGYMFSSLPNCGKPSRLMIYDVHTLQNRFFLHGNTVASLHTAVPLLLQRLKSGSGEKSKRSKGSDRVTYTIAFPDEGAAKRFSMYFENWDIIICGKTRTEDDGRKVVIHTGKAEGRNVVIVDDLVQSGGTLYECALSLKAKGAKSVSAYVTHAVFPNESWRRFVKGGDRACFEKFWVTDSIPSTINALRLYGGTIFEILPLKQLILHDLDNYVTGDVNDYPDLGVRSSNCVCL
eukprot:CAMPEP_0203675616 /NCGR_PEP_ID=MMETSP0090-20130426/21452_1 /ASSEMBLY_ACC=CAM_ASM_001088 /TAXON_ID=426623 /ORGANISM="Chaetoceros affinis, Strain CCMP159" /LENGTH=366 /DNA_ID=CAMNT_0050541887 /DNA_START=17 /DNA_END=1117 /DNA_ORIENTATION=+